MPRVPGPPVAFALALTGCGAATYGGLTEAGARHKAEQAVVLLSHGGTKLSFKSERKGSDSRGRDAWPVYFDPLSGYGSGYSGCVVVTNSDAATPSPECLRF